MTYDNSSEALLSPRWELKRKHSLVHKRGKAWVWQIRTLDGEEVLCLPEYERSVAERIVDDHNRVYSLEHAGG